MRIVSLVPSLTELVVHLGLRGDLVGVTRWCVRPPGLLQQPGLAVVGGTKDPDLDRIRSLCPDLVLANREENEREHVEALREVAEVLVTDVRTVADAIDLSRLVAARLGRRDEGEDLAARIETARSRVASAAGPRFLVLVWRKPWMGAGPDTYLADLLRTVGGVNAIDAAEPRYPLLEDPAATIRAADLVVLPSEPFPFAARHAEEIEALGGRPVLADGELLTWYGSRTPEGLEHAAAILGRM